MSTRRRHEYYNNYRDGRIYSPEKIGLFEKTWTADSRIHVELGVDEYSVGTMYLPLFVSGRLEILFV